MLYLQLIKDSPLICDILRIYIKLTHSIELLEFVGQYNKNWEINQYLQTHNYSQLTGQKYLET